MTTAAKIRKLTKPILANNQDLILVRKENLWVHPVHHIGCHIHFRRGREAYFTLQWHLSALFVPAIWIAPHPGSFHDLIGRSCIQVGRPRIFDQSEIYRSNRVSFDAGSGLWEYEDPEIAEDLEYNVELVLRLIRSLNTLEKCISYLRLRNGSVPCQIEHWSMLMDIAVGDFDAAREFWLTVRKFHVGNHSGNRSETPTGFFERIAFRYRELDEPLMARDGAGLASLMHRWEEENVRLIDIREIWKPTPFPFEK